MKLVGIYEDFATGLLEKIEGEWIFKEKGVQERLSENEAKRKLKSIIDYIKSKKKGSLTSYAVLIFVDDVQKPKYFKIYDFDSLACTTREIPPRWELLKI